ncbi:MAG: hypothetical protein JWN64_459 [Parcubacteria group bacterium]|nr:hypothetical protein [Parcubacteria group bacterium]
MGIGTALGTVVVAAAVFGLTVCSGTRIINRPAAVVAQVQVENAPKKGIVEVAVECLSPKEYPAHVGSGLASAFEEGDRMPNGAAFFAVIADEAYLVRVYLDGKTPCDPRLIKIPDELPTTSLRGGIFTDRIHPVETSNGKVKFYEYALYETERSVNSNTRTFVVVRKLIVQDAAPRPLPMQRRPRVLPNVA